MMYNQFTRIKKPLFQAFGVAFVLVSSSLLLPSSTQAQNRVISPVPGYSRPQIKGEHINNNSEPLNYASLGYPLVALGIGSGLISGLAFYKRKKQKDAEAINFIDPQTQ